MSFLGSSRWIAVIGAIAFCTFVGDIVADAIADACDDHCISQSSQSDPQQEKTPCSHCSCAIHNGNVIVSNNAVLIDAASTLSFLIPTVDQSAPPGLPPAIDHPPQLG